MRRLSKDYPAPIVDHQKARDENLKKFKEAVDNRKQGKAFVKDRENRLAEKLQEPEDTAAVASPAKALRRTQS